MSFLTWKATGSQQVAVVPCGERSYTFANGIPTHVPYEDYQACVDALGALAPTSSVAVGAKAAYSTSQGSNKDCTYTAANPGTVPNSSHISLLDPGVPSVAAVVAAASGPDVIVTQKSNDGDLAALTTTAAGGVNARATLTSKLAGVAGNGISLTIVGGAGDHAEAIAVAGTAITYTPARTAGSIDSTASDMKAKIEADTAANALVTVTLPGTGAVAVSAQAVTLLSGGGANYAMTGTADNVRDAINNTAATAAIMAAARKATQNGTGVPAPFAAASLAGGTGGEL